MIFDSPVIDRPRHMNQMKKIQRSKKKLTSILSTSEECNDETEQSKLSSINENTFDLNNQSMSNYRNHVKESAQFDSTSCISLIKEEDILDNDHNIPQNLNKIGENACPNGQHLQIQFNNLNTSTQCGSQKSVRFDFDNI